MFRQIRRSNSPIIFYLLLKLFRQRLTAVLFEQLYNEKFINKEGKIDEFWNTGNDHHTLRTAHMLIKTLHKPQTDHQFWQRNWKYCSF